MTCRRLSLPCACASFAAVVLLALPIAPAFAAGPKVLLVTRSEEGNGPPAVQGERAEINNFVILPERTVFCGGSDENGTVGKNPAGKVKVSGSDTPLTNAQCEEAGTEEAQPVQGSILVKSVSVAKSGVVQFTGKVEVTAGGCTYRVTKLTGTQVFGEEEQFADELTGTAKLGPHSAKTCAKTEPVHAYISAANADDYNYVVKLTE